MGSLGIWELLLILVVAAIVLGPDKLPDTARQVGKSVRSFRGELKKMDDSLQTEIKDIVDPEDIKELRKDLDEIKQTLHDTKPIRKKP